MVEGARLESVYTSNRIVGSNPTLSAINLISSILNRRVFEIVSRGTQFKIENS